MTAEKLKKELGAEYGSLTRECWAKAALTAVGRGGVANVKVETLAKSLRVTKGSFYWHFKDRDDLLQEMLIYWRRNLTDKIANNIQKLTEPRQKLIHLIEVASGKRPDVPGGRIEHSLREWAHSSDIARAAVAIVDAERLKTIAGVYRELGLSPAKAKIASLMMLSHIIGVNVIDTSAHYEAGKTQRQNCIEFLLRLPDLL